jgi:hypothetical protein
VDYLKTKTRKKKPRGAMIFEEDDIKLIYRALRAYKAAEKEKHLHSVLTEAFEESLTLDFFELYYD